METERIIQMACGCTIGRVRKNNEDNLFFNGRCLDETNDGLPQILFEQVTTAKPVCAAVLDGMGGGDYGECASFGAAARMQKILSESSKSENPTEFLGNMAAELNTAVCQLQEKLETQRMGSTMAMLYMDGTSLYSCNVGDSRVYGFRDDTLLQISVDDTDEAFMKKRGITGRNPRVTQYLGMDVSQVLMEPHVKWGQLQPGDRYLICSDGLTDMVSDEEIAEVLRNTEDIQEAVQKLIALAMDHGGIDNTTVILCQVEKTARKTTEKGFSAGPRLLPYGIGALALILLLVIILPGKPKNTEQQTDPVNTELQETMQEIPSYETTEEALETASYYTGAQDTNPPPAEPLRSCGMLSPFWNACFPVEDIREIRIEGVLPRQTQDWLDISIEKDGSVFGRMIQEGEQTILILSAEGKVIAPENSDGLFANFPKLERILLNGCFDTSRVTSMERMFYNCPSLSILDLSCMDTSSVENMREMFYGTEYLENPNFQNFDTSRVEKYDHFMQDGVMVGELPWEDLFEQK